MNDVIAGGWILAAMLTRDEAEDHIRDAWDQILDVGGRIAIAVVVFIVAHWVARLIRRIVWRRIQLVDVTPATESLVNNSISVVVYFFGLTIILALWGTTWATLLAAIGIGTLAIVFGLQDLLRSLLGGAFIVAERPFEIGDRIRFREFTGEVADIKLRTTILRTDDGFRLTIPNSVHLTDPLINLDRPLATSSFVVVKRIEGDPEEIRTRVERALLADPPIGASIRVVGRQHGWWRSLLRNRSAALPGKAPVVIDDETGVKVRVMLAATGEPRLTEKNTVARLKSLFPEGEVTVRRGTKLGS